MSSDSLTRLTTALASQCRIESELGAGGMAVVYLAHDIKHDRQVAVNIANDLLRVEYAFYTPWDVAADGRFIMARARRGDAASATTVVVAENWLTELKARVKQ